MSRTLPIAKLVMPSTLNGQQNGRLPDSLLTTIGVGNARMERTAARSFIAMFAEARRAIGVTVKHVGDYRPFETQLNLFLSRYQQATLAQYTVTPAAHRKVWKEAPFNGYQSTYWIKKKNANGSYPATAATPGNSNHGWGLALDIAEEYDSDAGPDPIRAVFVGWLCEEAHRYGVSAELQSEPWHWRYVAGDRIPVATLEFERNNGVVPPPPVPTPGPASVLAYPGIPIVRGSTFIDAVKMVQTKVGATPDGDFGPTTERRVKDWQKSHALLPDGVVGVVTWKKMFG